MALPEIADLRTESDVEQKFIYPLLTAALPMGLGLSSSDIQTKANIRRFNIDKGVAQKLYFPDYIVALGGLPLAAIEAKAVGEDLAEAFREVRLYAAELNAVWPSGLNPLGYVVATDGSRILAGPWDQANPELELERADLSPYSEKFAKLQSSIGKPALQAIFENQARKIKPTVYEKPRRLIGGAAVQNEEIGHNSFGATIAAEFGRIFSPESPEDRAFIARNAYIKSKRRERFIEPIDRVIRASRPPSHVHATEIEDTGDPREIIDKFRDLKPLEHQVLLLIGSVGSGKSTFVDYLHEVALDADIKASTVWVRMNMNPAPISPHEIYDWLRERIIEGITTAYPEIDFEELQTLKKLFGPQVRQYHKGTGRLYADNEQLYHQKLGELIDSLNNDLQARATAFARYCAGERGKLLVIVLDNSDKRLRDEQLLMFQAAEWLQKQFRALVVLPLREETYDNHRDQPPLDTALKSLVFRIEPPLFQQVLMSRVQLTLNALGKASENTFTYDLPNGFRVQYAASDQAFYLMSIIRSIFEHDRYIRRMIVGLAGANIRRALEIFLEFCTSGHIPEDQIFRIRQNNGQYTLPLYMVMRVLLRMHRRYYDSDFSYLKNILAADRLDLRPTYFSRLMTLRWLHGQFNAKGPSGLKGYFKVSQIKQEIIPLGVEEKTIDRELEKLVQAQCIITEDLRTEGLTDDVLIRLASPGFVHLDTLASIDYLAAVAEDTWFSDVEVARRVAERIKSLDTQYERDRMLANARDLTQYMESQREKEMAGANAFLNSGSYQRLTDLQPASHAVERVSVAQIAPVWRDAELRYPPGTELVGTINNRVAYGIFVEIEPGLAGLLHKSQLPKNFSTDVSFLPGEEIRVRVVRVDSAMERISLAAMS